MTQRNQRGMKTVCESSTLGDLLERILDKGIVISGDIKVKLVDIELLTIQIRLVICSVDKAREIGIDWWSKDKVSGEAGKDMLEMERLRLRIKKLEQSALRKEVVA